MTSQPEQLDDSQKELCAVLVMRMVLEDYCTLTGIPTEEAFYSFTRSGIYELLFDFSSGLWREGPNYVRELFEEAISQRNRV